MLDCGNLLIFSELTYFHVILIRGYIHSFKYAHKNVVILSFICFSFTLWHKKCCNSKILNSPLKYKCLPGQLKIMYKICKI